ncbi:hypothetical protein G9A89_019655 [Geosiphon pyriformis]|nr:hypothetical protein G9A89_019655 [Geosiphon pyriformis]
MEMATSLAREKEININSDFKRQGMRSDWAVVIKKIPMNTPKDMIVAAVSEFGEIKLIKIQLIEMWQKAVDSVRIVKTVENCDTWASKDQFKTLLFTLPVGTTAHNLGTLLEKTGRKTCIINRFLETGNRIHCAVVGFKSDNNLESTFCTEPIFGGIKLSWTRMDLVWCEKCRKFDHSALKCNALVASPFAPPKTFKRIASDGCCLQLAKLYEKKMVLLAGFSDGSCFSSGSSSSLSLSGALGSNIDSLLISDNNSSLNAHLATLEHSLELLTNWVSSILKKLSGMGLVLMATPFSVPLLATSSFLALYLDVDMAVDNMSLASAPPLSAVDDVVYDSSLSFSKVLTSKVGRLESKMVAFEVSINSVLERLDRLCSGAVATCNVRGMNNSAKQKDIAHSWLVDKFDDVYMFSSGLDSGYINAGVAIVMNRSLAKHVYKISKVLGYFLCIRLLFKNKLLVSILGLYAGAFLATQFSQADEINSLIVKAMNESSFVILGGDFNEDGSHKIVKTLRGENAENFVYLMECWNSVNDVKSSVVQNLVNSGAGFNRIHFAFFGTRKSYRASKLTESLRAKETNIRFAIDKRMKSFEINKGHTIRSVLEHPFCKVVLNYLMINDDLILEPDLVKSKVDVIIEGWTRKCHVADNISIDWHHQYQSLEYVFDEVFSGIICPIGFDELFGVISDLPDGKAAGLSGISNEL